MNRKCLQRPLTDGEILHYLEHDMSYALIVENTGSFAVKITPKFSSCIRAETELFIGVHMLMGSLDYTRIRCY